VYPDSDTTSQQPDVFPEEMNSRTTYRRRRVILVTIALLLIASVAFAVRLGLDLLTGPALVPAAGGGSSGAAADGEIQTGERVSVHDTHLPALANLDPELLAAIQRAADDAAAEDIEFVVTSGWRSPAYQARLLSEAVLDYGSEEEAARWVSTPETSLHVSGDAIDIGDFDATYWLSLNGAPYGLCQIYANERWHFELRPEAVDVGCPEQYLDPTYDPRMQPQP
jgi:zinc D-Ala-D-Ala carboxypeptidase